MHFAPVFQSVTTTDAGGNAIGPQLTALRAIKGGMILGGAPSVFAYGMEDMPRQYAAYVKWRVMPLVGNNSEQVRFPPLIRNEWRATVNALSPLSGVEIPPRGEWAAQRRQLPRPIRFQIGGVTRDSTGTILGTCVVKLYYTSNDLEIAQVTSDGSGNYAFWVGDSVTNYYVVAYKAGAPDVAGTTLNTLKGV